MKLLNLTQRGNNFVITLYLPQIYWFLPRQQNEEYFSRLADELSLAPHYFYNGYVKPPPNKKIIVG
jgi:hypothetical protein